MKIIFFGSSSYVIPILETLRKNFNLALVVTTEANPTDPILSYCHKYDLRYLSIKTFDPETISQIEKINAPLAVIASFGLILPQKILHTFPKGILNIHPSLLPKYRGTTPVQTAIVNGDKTTGVTIMQLDEKMDHGPLLVQQEESISPTDTAKTLYDRLFLIGSKLLTQSIQKYINENLVLTAQDDAKATYTKRLTKQSGFFNLAHPLPFELFEKMVRAFYPWPGVWTITTILNKEVRIKFLPNNQIQVEGKKPMSVKDFLNGYPQATALIRKLGFSL